MNQKLVGIVDFFLERLKERSTWRALPLVLAGVGVSLEPQLIEYIVAAGIAMAGAIEMCWPEPKAPK